MKKLLITGSIIAAIFFSGCIGKYRYDIAEDPSKLSNLNLESFFNEVKQSEPLREGMAEIIYYGKKEHDSSMFVNGITLSEAYCKSQNGIFKGTSFHIRGINLLDYDTRSNVCIVDNKPYFLISYGLSYSNGTTKIYDAFIDISKSTLDSYAIYEKKEAEKHELYRLREENRIKAEKEKKVKEEIEFNKKVKLLKNRKGTIEAVFYDNFNYKYGKENCNKSCNRLTLDNSGYESLQQALDDKWQFVSYVGDAKNDVDSSCSCNGKKVILKK